MVIFNSVRSCSLSIFFCSLLLSISFTTAHAVVIDFKLNVNHPNGDLSGVTGAFMDSFPGTMEVLFELPENFTGADPKYFEMESAEIRIGDHVLSATRATLADNLSVLRGDWEFRPSPFPDILSESVSFGIVNGEFEFVSGPLIGSSIIVSDLLRTGISTSESGLGFRLGSDLSSMQGSFNPDGSLSTSDPRFSSDPDFRAFLELTDEGIIGYSDTFSFSNRVQVPYKITESYFFQAEIYEPATITLLGFGLVCIGYQHRRRLAG